MKTLIRKLLPHPLELALRTTYDKFELASLPKTSCDTQKLKSTEQLAVKDTFHQAELANAWQQAQAQLTRFSIPDGSGGVNPGDRRALFYLIRSLQPQNVLEVGTHIGSSTLHIATAMQQYADPAHPVQLTTVDIADVNDPVQQPWLNFGSPASPLALIEAIGCQDWVNFVQADSIAYLAQCQKTFDFIFLDGSHTAKAVYQEVPLALQLLNPSGIILLHDYFPDLQPLWSDNSLIPGPCLAIDRLKQEGAKLQVIPLGELPWATKLNSNVTSLAIVLRA